MEQITKEDFFELATGYNLFPNLHWWGTIDLRKNQEYYNYAYNVANDLYQICFDMNYRDCEGETIESQFLIVTFKDDKMDVKHVTDLYYDIDLKDKQEYCIYTRKEYNIEKGGKINYDLIIDCLNEFEEKYLKKHIESIYADIEIRNKRIKGY